MKHSKLNKEKQLKLIEYFVVRIAKNQKILKLIPYPNGKNEDHSISCSPYFQYHSKRYKFINNH